MKIWKQLKSQFDWYKKYRSSIQQRLFNEDADRAAAAHALQVLAKYEALTASLPLDHELSTQTYWKDHADRRLMRENENLRNSMDHLRDTYNGLANQWIEGISRYGVQMYGKWQPMELAPENTTVLVSNGKQIDLASKLDGNWYSKGLPFDEQITHWMALPEGPK